MTFSSFHSSECTPGHTPSYPHPRLTFHHTYFRVSLEPRHPNGYAGWRSDRDTSLHFPFHDHDVGCVLQFISSDFGVKSWLFNCSLLIFIRLFPPSVLVWPQLVFCVFGGWLLSTKRRQCILCIYHPDSYETIFFYIHIYIKKIQSIQLITNTRSTLHYTQ